MTQQGSPPVTMEGPAVGKVMHGQSADSQSAGTLSHSFQLSRNIELPDADRLSAASVLYRVEALQAQVGHGQAGHLSGTALSSSVVSSGRLSLQLVLPEAQLSKLLGSVGHYLYQIEHVDGHGLLRIEGDAVGIQALLRLLPDYLSGERQGIVLRDADSVVLGRYIYEPESGHLVHTSNAPIGGGASAFALQRIDRLTPDSAESHASSEALHFGYISETDRLPAASFRPQSLLAAEAEQESKPATDGSVSTGSEPSTEGGALPPVVPPVTPPPVMGVGGPVNTAPVALDDTDSTAEDVALALNISDLLFNDSDAQQSLTSINFALITTGTNGTVVNNGNGTLTYTPDANYNGADSFTYTVTDSGGLTSTATVNLTVTAVNDAPVATDDTFALDENSANGTAVGTVAATDVDTGDTLTYAITVGNGLGGFAINAATGQITVADATKLDYEAVTSFTLTVSVTDNGAGTLSDTATITINLNDLADTAITDSNTGANTVAEGAANTTAVGITALAGGLGGGVTYSLTDSAGGRFAIDGTTGVVSVADGTLLDYETATSHGITVKATNGVIDLTQNFTVNVSNANPGAISDSNAGANTVAENAAIGTMVGVTATSTDVNGPAIVYSLTDDAGGLFQIHSGTGVVTTKAALDYETANSHSITVQASDGAGGTRTQNFTINVSDVAEPLTLTSAITDMATTASGAAAYTYNTSTHFTGGVGAVTYTITSLAYGTGDPSTWVAASWTAAGLAINAATGVITGIPDVNDRGVAYITVTATDTAMNAVSESFELFLHDGTAVLGTTGVDDMNYATTSGIAYTLFGNDGSDTIRGDNAADVIHGGDSDDTIIGNWGDDTIYGGAGADSINSGNLDDLVYGGEGNDVLIGGNGVSGGSDTLYGGDGNDTLNGGDGHELLYGGAGADSLNGGNDNDTLDGGAGQDNHRGGSGTNYFVFSALTDSTSAAPDTILDWGTGTSNKIGISALGITGIGAGASQVTISNDGTSTYISHNSSTFQIRLSGVQALAAGDFVFTASPVALASSITDMAATASGAAAYTYNTSTHFSGGVGALTYTITSLAYGTGDPFTWVAASWTAAGLAINAATGVITGTPDVNDRGVAYITVTATDTAMNAVSESFELFLNDGTVLSGSTGADNVTAQTKYFGDAGNDTIGGTAGADTLHGGDGVDSIDGLNGNDLIYGGDGADSLEGGQATDTVYGGEGNDYISDNSGHNNMLYGGSGDDTIYGQGINIAYGGDGADSITAHATNTWDDTYYGGAGNDTLWAGSGNDLLYGGDGIDSLSGGNNNDILYGDAGNDWLDGGSHNDTLDGGDGDDTLLGGNESDSLVGGAGADSLYGGSTNHSDTLDGGLGTDTLTGGNGADRFVFSSLMHSVDGASDLITDFSIAQTDKIDLSALGITGIGGGASQVTISNDGTYTYVNHNSSTFLVTLTGVYALVAGDFVFDTSAPTLSSSISDMAATANGVAGFTYNAGAHFSDAGIITYTLSSIVYSTGDPSSWVAASWTAAALSINSSTGIITGTPDVNDRGVVYITVTATDAGGYATSETLELFLNDGTVTVGTSGDDNIVGTIGADSYFGANGNDIIDGGSGNDTLHGGDGADSLNGGNNDDTLYGGDSADTLQGNSGNDLMYSGDGADSLNGGSGDDTIYGGNGGDTVLGSSNNDLVYGGSGDDSLNGGSESDTLYGGADNDTLNGSTETDLLYGGAGADSLNAGSGDDTLDGGADADTLTGGANNDTFVFSNLTHSTSGSPDRITDFQNGTDLIKLTGLGFTALSDFETLSYNGTITTLADTQTGFAITFTGDVTAQLDNTDFVW